MSMAEQSQGSSILVVEREEMLVSASGGDPILRLAHFLTPCVSSIDGCAFDVTLPAEPLISVTKEALPATKFRGCKNSSFEWREWVDLMHSEHQILWKKVGILEAVLDSKYTIHRDEKLLQAFAARWSLETKSFVFSWGEATITLEDVMILGGYSVVGDPVFSPVRSPEMRGIEEKLQLARSEFSKSRAKKASHRAWLEKFMGSGSEIEHEAFLVYWLSRFVFPLSEKSIMKCVFPIAVHLAKGTKIAIAPAVLASIYSDLSRYQKTLHASARLIGSKNQNIIPGVFISAPFNLVQIWLWERFPFLQPNPNNLKVDDPIFAKWHGLRRNCDGDVMNAHMDKAADEFVWRPYTSLVKSFFPSKSKTEKEQCLSIASGTNGEVEALVKCLRVSELVGIVADCIEQYLPHRVARQFGLDQDIPCPVVRAYSDRQLAWENYNRPITDVAFCIPLCIFESNVTIRYLEWWKKSVSARDGSFKAFVDVMNPKELKKRKFLGSSAKDLKAAGCAFVDLSSCDTMKGKGSEKNGEIFAYSNESEVKILECLTVSDSEDDCLDSPWVPTQRNAGKENKDAFKTRAESNILEEMPPLKMNEKESHLDTLASPSSEKLNELTEDNFKHKRAFGNGESYKTVMSEKALKSAAKITVDEDVEILPKFSDKIEKPDKNILEENPTAESRKFRRIGQGSSETKLHNWEEKDGARHTLRPDKSRVSVELAAGLTGQNSGQTDSHFPSKEFDTFIQKISETDQQIDETKPCPSKVSLLELEARVFKLEKLFARYMSDERKRYALSP